MLKQLAFILFVVLLPLSVGAADKIVITKNKNYPLCQEVQQILQAPENNNYITSYIEEARQRTGWKLFNIPQRFKNFALLAWQPTSLDEAEKALPNTYAIIRKERATEIALIQSAQKATTQLTPDGPTGLFYLLEKEQNRTALYLKEDGSYLANQFNSNFNSMNMPFYYKGQLYLSGKVDFMNVVIYEPNIGYPTVSSMAVDQPEAINELALIDVCVLTAKPKR